MTPCPECGTTEEWHDVECLMGIGRPSESPSMMEREYTEPTVRCSCGEEVCEWDLTIHWAEDHDGLGLELLDPRDADEHSSK